MELSRFQVINLMKNNVTYDVYLLTFSVLTLVKAHCPWKYDMPWKHRFVHYCDGRQTFCQTKLVILGKSYSLESKHVFRLNSLHNTVDFVNLFTELQTMSIGLLFIEQTYNGISKVASKLLNS